MSDWTKVSINFDTSHLVFPTIVLGILLFLGAAIILRDFKRIAGAGAYWKGIFEQMHGKVFFGTIALTFIYFSLMVPIGNIWPNTGLGFLICSVPYVFLTGALFAHEHSKKVMLPLIITAIIGPLVVWWLFTSVFFLTLP